MSLEYSHNFPPKNIDLEKIVALVGKANSSLSRYDGFLENMINPEILLSPLLMKEVVLSSRIEGIIATANEVYQQQAGVAFLPEKNADIDEIINYRDTLLDVEEELHEKPISLHLLRQMHGTLMQGVRGANKNPGKFRTTQNWIGSPRCKIEQATYIPPSPLILNDLLEQLIEFINRSDESLDPLIQAALVHAQFELIHPFDDGNGRIGRILIPLLLVKRQILVYSSLCISSYLAANRDMYTECLGQISTKGDWLGWITFFLNAVVEQSKRNLEIARNIIKLYDDTKVEISELLRSDQAIHILDALFDKPVFTAHELCGKLDIQRQRAAYYIRKLKDAKIIVEVCAPRGRRPALLSFETLLEITDQQ